MLGSKSLLQWQLMQSLQENPYQAQDPHNPHKNHYLIVLQIYIGKKKKR